MISGKGDYSLNCTIELRLSENFPETAPLIVLKPEDEEVKTKLQHANFMNRTQGLMMGQTPWRQGKTTLVEYLEAAIKRLRKEDGADINNSSIEIDDPIPNPALLGGSDDDMDIQP